MLLLLRHALLLSMVTADFDRYAGYLPTTSVTDLAALDLDQEVFNVELTDRHIDKALFVYEEGGHSGSYAKLTLTNLGQPAASYPIGTQVYGKNDAGEQVVGELRTAVSWGEDTVLAKVINVFYKVSDKQENHVGCQVGGLWRESDGVLKGCFSDQGNATTVRLVRPNEGENLGSVYEYTYDIRRDNENFNTLQNLSTFAETFMRLGNKYIPEFQLFLNYYGDPDYGDKFVVAAATGKSTAFSSGYVEHYVSRRRLTIVSAAEIMTLVSLANELDATKP